MTLTQSESDLLKIAINSARQRQTLEDKLRRETQLLRQKRAQNKETFRRKLMEHSLKSAGIEVADFTKSQARELELVDASWVKYKADSAQLSKMVQAQQQAEIDRYISDAAATGKFKRGASPDLTHIGPIILDTADDILSSENSFNAPPPAKPQTGRTPKHNFIKASLGVGSGDWFGNLRTQGTRADYYFLFTPDQDGFLGTSAQVFYNGIYFLNNSETWGIGFADSEVQLNVMYANPAGLGVPVLQDSMGSFSFTATGGPPLVGNVVSGDYSGSITLSSGSRFFRVFANTSIFIDVAVFLGVDETGPAGAYLDFSSDTFEINVPAVSLDLFV